MSAKWPSAVATDADLYTAVNLLQTTLSGNINNAVTTITLASTTGFPTAGAVTIDNEVIFYTGVSGATITGCTRGSDGTTAASHNSGVPVGATIVAFHHNGLMAEIEAIETDLHTRFGFGSTAVAIPVAVTMTSTLTLTEPDNTPTVTINPTHSAFTSAALYINTTRAANSAFNLVALQAGGIEQFHIDGTGATLQVGAATITPTTNQLVLGSTRTVTITAPTPATASRTWTIPDITASGTFAALEGTQTFSGAKTFSAAVTVSASSGNTFVVNTNDFVVDSTNHRGIFGGTAAKSSEKVSVQVTGSGQPFLIDSNGTSGTTDMFTIQTGQGSGAIGSGRYIVFTDGGTSKFLVLGSGTTQVGDGSVSIPGLGFAGDTDSGLYRIGTNDIALATNGTKGLEVDANQNVVVPNGDLYTTALTDYSGTSTIVGWSSFTTKTLRYKKVGKTVFVYFDLRGTSNSTSTSFTLPVATSGNIGLVVNATQYFDNGTAATTPGQSSLASGTSTVNLYTNWNAGAWTASSTKIVIGTVIYETA